MKPAQLTLWARRHIPLRIPFVAEAVVADVADLR